MTLSQDAYAIFLEISGNDPSEIMQLPVRAGLDGQARQTREAPGARRRRAEKKDEERIADQNGRGFFVSATSTIYRKTAWADIKAEILVLRVFPYFNAIMPSTM